MASSLLYLTTTTTTTTTTRIWKKKSPDGSLARHWQDIEKYMLAVEDKSVVLTNSLMGVGEKQRRLNPVERSQSGPISTPVLTQSDSERIETRFSWEFAGQSWCFFWRPSLLGPLLLFWMFGWMGTLLCICQFHTSLSTKNALMKTGNFACQILPHPPCWLFSPFSPNA